MRRVDWVKKSDFLLHLAIEARSFNFFLKDLVSTPSKNVAGVDLFQECYTPESESLFLLFLMSKRLEFVEDRLEWS